MRRCLVASANQALPPATDLDSNLLKGNFSNKRAIRTRWNYCSTGLADAEKDDPEQDLQAATQERLPIPAPRVGNGLACGAAAGAPAPGRGPAVVAAAGHIPRRTAAASRALRGPSDRPAAALDPATGPVGRCHRPPPAGRVRPSGRDPD
jgi:hypothetical protein